MFSGSSVVSWTVNGAHRQRPHHTLLPPLPSVYTYMPDHQPVPTLPPTRLPPAWHACTPAHLSTPPNFDETQADTSRCTAGAPHISHPRAQARAAAWCTAWVTFTSTTRTTSATPAPLPCSHTPACATRMSTRHFL